MKPRVLLLSAYAASSHRLWSERLRGLFPGYDWVELTLPPRHFNWTIRGNSLLWAFNQRQLLQQNFDLLLATSMVDLSSLRGFIPHLAAIPTIVYFHENQFHYPTNAQRNDNVEPQLVPLYAALCADRIVFNSHFNRNSFLEGARSLFQRLPDTIPARIMQQLQASSVIPVPVPRTPPQRPTPANKSGVLEVVWNHRWEYDKGTDLLLEVCKYVQTESLPVRLHIVGEQFRQQPPEMQMINALLAQHANARQITRGEFGTIPSRADYDSLLSRCDVVLSTARHDFQGLAVQEACMAGCTPLVPKALVYPEYLDSRFLYTDTGNHILTAASIGQQLGTWQMEREAGMALPKADLSAYADTVVGQQYASLFAGLLQ